MNPALQFPTVMIFGFRFVLPGWRDGVENALSEVRYRLFGSLEFFGVEQTSPGPEKSFVISTMILSEFDLGTQYG